MPRNGGRAAARRALFAVGAVYLGLQFLLLSMDRPPSWDEAIYLSQVDPDRPGLFFAPSRARGITFLVAPMVLTGAPMWALRLFLSLASAAALVMAFGTWVRHVSFAAPIAALIFGVSWPALFYGAEAMPNLWAALLVVAATGTFVTWIHDGSGRHLVASSALIAVLAVFRPIDSLPVAAAFLIASLIGSKRSIRGATVLGAGLLLGWLPWVVEMSLRFGGPLEAVRQAAGVGHLEGQNASEGLKQHLALSDGPLLGPESPADVPVAGVLWWSGTFLLGLLAWLRAPRGPLRWSTRLLGGTAVLLAGQYVLLVTGFAPRFLLPAFALAALLAGLGLTLLRSRPWRLAAAVLLVSFAGWSAVTADRLERGAVANRHRAQEAGLFIRSGLDGGPCLVVAAAAHPQIAYAARCRGWMMGVGADRYLVPRIRQRVDAGDRVILSPVSDAQVRSLCDGLAPLRCVPFLEDPIVHEVLPAPPAEAAAFLASRHR